MTRRRLPIGVRRPRLVLAGAAVALVLLGVLGINVESKLQPGSLRVPGTESARGNEVLDQHFGDSAPFAILLEGPPSQLDRQGPALVELLRRDRRVTTLSPWDRGAGLGRLRPSRRKALILADFHVPLAQAITITVTRLDRLLSAHVSAPVRARAASYASVAKAIQDQSITVAQRGEEIVTPILLIVLLLVFRSPIAAAIPLVFGATTVIASRGLMSIAADFVDINGLSLSVASMIGLALGVDYALLIVSRFREELASGASPRDAAAITRSTAGRTTIFAGSTLLVSILVAVFLVPGALLVSLCSTVVAVIVLAVVGPWLVGPAILVLVGDNINRWSIASRAPTGTRWLAISAAALRRPPVAVIASGLLLLFIAAPAVSLATGPVTIEQLPESNPTRRNVEEIEASVGSGWVAPSIVVLASSRGPITEPSRLAALNRWQTVTARDPGVVAVIGPGHLIQRTTAVQREGKSFLAGDKSGTSATKLTSSLERAGDGLSRLRRGLGRASEAALALSAGSGQAEHGAFLLTDGLAIASAGGARAMHGLARFAKGAHLLADGERAALFETSVLPFGIDELGTDVGRHAIPEAEQLEQELANAAAALPTAQRAAAVTLTGLEAAWAELGRMSSGTADPSYPALAAAIRESLTAASGGDPVSGARFAADYEGLPSALDAVYKGLRAGENRARTLRSRLAEVEQSIRLTRSLAQRLHRHVGALKHGSERLADGSDRIVGAALRLGAGLARLNSGARRLTVGLSRLRGGNARLERGLSYAFSRSRPLVSGARGAEARISSSREGIERNSPGFFESGYFVLSALDGASPRKRELAGQAIDLERGGQAAAMLVIAKHGLADPNAVALNERLRHSAETLARETDAQVELTGGSPQITDYARVTSARIPSLVIVITLITFLAMVAIVRALPLAAIAVALNLLTVAAAFGVLRLVILAPAGLPFGGVDHIDPVGAAGIFGVVFGVSIDYAVFLLMRMRESWERDGDHSAAIAYGLERTASVITGAATVMAVVFCVFATASIVTVAQFGIGLTVAILLDATVIRLALLPALMKLIGPGVWWLPAGLDRRLPKLNVDRE